VVYAIGGDALRETVIRVAESDFLQGFLRTRKKAVMDCSFLDKCFNAVRPETWKQINEVLVEQAVAGETADAATIRVDTTAVETNIHWPTDASLLWDTYRVAARLMRRGRDVLMASCPYRFHERKIRRLWLFVTRYSASKSKKRLRKVKRSFRTLIERMGQIVEKSGHFCEFAKQHGDLDLLLVAAELEAFLPSTTKVVDQARRAQLDGETVPASERVFSIFEPHTELIRRGRRSKPTEFGHMILLCQSPEKLIADYDVMPQRVADCRLTEKVIDRHEKLFGQPPNVLAGDRGFCPAAEEYEELEQRVETLAIPRRMRDFADAVMSRWQAFRAGIEGTISGLKRAFRLARCLYRGFTSFAASIGLAVFSHNLVVPAKSGAT